MSTTARPWLWQLPDWPHFTFDVTRAATALAHAHELKGRIYGMARAIGVSGLQDAVREVWTQEALSTAAIEGQTLDLQAVRSSVLKRLGADDGGPVQRHVEGLVEVLQDATRGHGKPLDLDRLCGWQSALFDGTAAHRRIAVGRLRDHAQPMEIVSGPIGREVVHYIAPPSAKVPTGIKAFLRWFAATTPKPGKPQAMDSIARAAIAHRGLKPFTPSKTATAGSAAPLPTWCSRRATDRLSACTAYHARSWPSAAATTMRWPPRSTAAWMRPDS